jgi:hypothetical protein
MQKPIFLGVGLHMWKFSTAKVQIVFESSAEPAKQSGERLKADPRSIGLERSSQK